MPTIILACFLQFYVYWTEAPFYEEKTNMAFFIHTWVVLLLLKILGLFAFVLIIGGLLDSYTILALKDERFKLFLIIIKSS